MKKKITLILFALALFSQSFANCLQAIFDMEKIEIAMFDENYEGLVPDSAYWDKGTANTRGKSIYIWKAYWNNEKIDSIYEANLRNGEWTYRTTKVPHDSIKVTHEENIWTISAAIDSMGTSPTTIYFDGDSIATTNTDEEGEYTFIYVMKNDTIFRRDQTEIIVMDEKDTNTCYQKDDRDNYQTIWYRYESAFINGRPTLSKTYIEEGLDHKTVTYFFHEQKKGISSIHNIIRPKLHIEKRRHFDLMGRPAKGKFTVQFLK